MRTHTLATQECGCTGPTLIEERKDGILVDASKSTPLPRVSCTDLLLSNEDLLHDIRDLLHLIEQNDTRRLELERGGRTECGSSADGVVGSFINGVRGMLSIIEDNARGAQSNRMVRDLLLNVHSDLRNVSMEECSLHVSQEEDPWNDCQDIACEDVDAWFAHLQNHLRMTLSPLRPCETQMDAYLCIVDPVCERGRPSSSGALSTTVGSRLSSVSTLSPNSTADELWSPMFNIVGLETPFQRDSSPMEELSPRQELLRLSIASSLFSTAP